MDRLAALRAFVRLVELGTFTGVAEELRISQSTVSKWLAALEEQHQVRLVDRTTRSQRITDAGQTLYFHAHEVLAAYDEATNAMKKRDTELRGRIRISVPVVFGRLFIVPQVAAFLRRHGDIEVSMILSDRYARLVEEGFDLAVRVGTPVDSSLRTHRLGDSSRRLVASRSYLNTHGVPLSPKELERHQCLVHSQPGAPTVWKFSRSGKTVRCSVSGRASANNSEATRALARSGLGICLLASWLVDGDIRSGRLVELLADYERPSAPINALTPPGRHTANHVRRLVEHLRNGLAKLSG